MLEGALLYYIMDMLVFLFCPIYAGLQNYEVRHKELLLQRYGGFRDATNQTKLFSAARHLPILYMLLIPKPFQNVYLSNI